MMENMLSYQPTTNSYPGDYIPLIDDREFAEGLSQPHEGEATCPPVNIIENENLVKVEIAIPGVRREDFLLHTEGNVLVIRVLHKEMHGPDLEKFRLHEFNYECFDRHLDLPENADTEFVSAEYKGGMLRLVIPKNGMENTVSQHRIVVY